VNLFAVGTDQKVYFTTQSAWSGTWGAWTTAFRVLAFRKSLPC